MVLYNFVKSQDWVQGRRWNLFSEPVREVGDVERPTAVPRSTAAEKSLFNSQLPLHERIIENKIRPNKKNLQPFTTILLQLPFPV